MSAGLPLSGIEFALSGHFATMDHAECLSRLESAGARTVSLPGPETRFLVLGHLGWPLQEDGKLTQKLALAHQLGKDGRAIQVISERRLLDLLGLEERVQDLDRLYTTAQLARILEVSNRTVRSWVRRKLITPSKVVRRLLYFDFPQVVRARTLGKLRKAGVHASEIQRSLELLAERHPDARSWIEQLDALESHGPLVIRLPSGDLAEPNGQLCFDFDSKPHATPEPIFAGTQQGPSTSESWFVRAVEAEERGAFEEALYCYEDALLAGGPDSEICFNLAGVLFALGRKPEAVQRYKQVVELEHDYVEAWNMLGLTLADIGRPGEATRAFEAALSIQADYADAHYNLAETLYQTGATESARRHFEAYLLQDPRSEWADRIRARLAELGLESESGPSPSAEGNEDENGA